MLLEITVHTRQIPTASSGERIATIAVQSLANRSVTEPLPQRAELEESGRALQQWLS
jgi:hypothetical protein